MRSIRDQRANDATAVILAGGRSRRMGQDKAALVIQGEPLIDRVARLLGLAFTRIAVVGGAALPGNATRIDDLRQGQGPLAGLESAFTASATTWLFVVGCDMPFVSPGLAAHMVELAASHPEVDVVALPTARGLEPLHAVYHRRLLPAITALLDGGDRSLRALLAQSLALEVAAADQGRFDPQGLATLNVNTPEEWRQALLLAERWRP